MLEDSNGSLQKILSHNEEVTASLAILSDLSNQTTSLESRLNTVHEVVSTLSSTASLGKFSDEIQEGVLDVKQTLDGVSERQDNDSIHKELLNLQQRLDVLSELQ